MRFVFALFLLSAFLFPSFSHAQCTMPDGKPDAAMGVIIFNTNHKVMQYCNGDNWVGIWGGGGSGGAALPSCDDGEIAQWVSGAWACNDGSGLDNINASNLKSGTVPPARLGSGTANNTTFLRGDGAWAAPAGGGGANCNAAARSLRTVRQTCGCSSCSAAVQSLSHNCAAATHGQAVACTSGTSVVWAQCWNGTHIQTGDGFYHGSTSCEGN